MTAAALNQAALPAIHEAFTAALPRIDDALHFHLRRWPRRDRDEAIATARAAAWAAWHGLVRRGKDPVVVGVTAIAFNAYRFVRNGRRLGNCNSGRIWMDIHQHRAQLAGGFQVVSYDSANGPGSVPPPWRSRLAADDRWSPADQAASRIDFESWLAGLSARKRQMAELLALGHETGAVARLLGVSAAAVSQARPWLAENWRRFQDDGDDSR